MDGPSNELKVPLILRPLLESFAREVLQNKPNDLIEFGRIYFEVFEEHRIGLRINNYDFILYEFFARFFEEFIFKKTFIKTIARIYVSDLKSNKFRAQTI